VVHVRDRRAWVAMPEKERIFERFVQAALLQGVGAAALDLSVGELL